jgi:hypothetical protein
MRLLLILAALQCSVVSAQKFASLPDGKVAVLYDDGTYKIGIDAVLKDGSLVVLLPDGKYLTRTEAPDLNASVESEPLADVQVKASFPGGESAFRKYIGSNFVYPPRCMEERINGYVILRFVVDQSGHVSRITAIEQTKSCPEFTLEAIRVLKKSPRWIPGQLRGKFVSSWREIPVALNAN